MSEHESAALRDSTTRNLRRIIAMMSARARIEAREWLGLDAFATALIALCAIGVPMALVVAFWAEYSSVATYAAKMSSYLSAMPNVTAALLLVAWGFSLFSLQRSRRDTCDEEVLGRIATLAESDPLLAERLAGADPEEITTYTGLRRLLDRWTAAPSGTERLNTVLAPHRDPQCAVRPRNRSTWRSSARACRRPHPQR